MEYQGRELATRFLAAGFRRGGGYRLVSTRANGQLAFGLYARDPDAGVTRAKGLLVLTLAGERISAITRFEPGVLPRFGLPPTLPE